MTSYNYNSSDPIRVALADLPERERSLLSESKIFCMYPWIHLHAYPTGETYPCCHAEMSAGPVGSTKQSTLQELWNSDRLRELRLDMLSEKQNNYCTRCYEQESSGFFSGRQSANKHHGHHVDRIIATDANGTVEQFEMTYWDIRFSNLCNLSCRSCGHIFSSSWYRDQVALAGPHYAEQNQPLNFAGRYETDIWEQLEPHLDYVEQIYFAGGEPLMMEEHYRILEELERRGRFDVRLIYNTNFTQVKLKNRLVFDYWKKFDSVAVGASLDAMGPRAEYIRKGTHWAEVEHNRETMMKICPDVDFYISPTLSVLNVFHLPEFHRNWTERGFIRAQDLNVNILQDPKHLRIDILPAAMKRQVRKLYQEHIQWLQPQDRLNRATVGYESALRFLDATDNSHFNLTFVQKTQELDRIRKEQCVDVLPELAPLL
jgi:MoaA/NifB/PqqE/SkfB family radical SAM enzyme